MENEIYQFLKKNNLTSKSEKDFLNEYADEKKAKELYGFFTKNDLTSKSFDEFYETYLKKKAQSPDSSSGSEPKPKGGGYNQEIQPNKFEYLWDSGKKEGPKDYASTKEFQTTTPESKVPNKDAKLNKPEDTPFYNSKFENDKGEYFVDGKKWTANELRDKLFDSDFVEDFQDGKIDIQIIDDPALGKLAQRQYESGTQIGDKWDYFVAGANQVASGVTGIQNYIANVMEEVTGVPFSKTPSAMMSKVASEEFAKKMHEKTLETRQYEGNFIESIGNGNISDAINIGFNAVAQSAPITGIAMATGGAGGLAGLGASSAVLSTILTPAEYASTNISEDENLQGLSNPENLGRAFAFGAAEGIGESITGGIAGRSFSVFKEGLRSFVKKTAKEAGTEAAREVAEGFARKTVPEMVKAFGIDAGKEGTSELVTGLIQDMTDDLMGVRDLSLSDYAYNGLENMALGVFMGGVLQGPRMTGQAMVNYFENERIQKGVEAQIDEQLEKGEITEEESVKMKEELGRIINTVNSIDKDIPQKLKERIAENSYELQKLQDETKGKKFVSPEKKKREEELKAKMAEIEKELNEVKDNGDQTDTQTIEEKRDDIERRRQEEVEEDVKNENKFNQLRKAVGANVDMGENGEGVLEGAFGIKTGEQKGPQMVISPIDKNTINLDAVLVEEADRGKGEAKKIIEKLTKEADNLGLTIKGTIAPDKNVDKEKWTKFLQSAGFEKRKGDNIIRKPKKKDTKPHLGEVLKQGEAQERRDKGEFELEGNTYKRQEPVKGVEGKETDVKFGEGNVPKAKYEAIEAEELQPAHLGGMRNPLHFIPEMQPKNRVDKASQAQSDKIAQNPNFDEVGESSNAYSGSPVVNSRGEVIQGNNRSEGLKKHYRQGGKQYREDLIKNAEKFGLSAEALSKMKNPVLVRKVESSDQDAIKLGQMTFTDVETGTKGRVEPVNLSRKLDQKTKKAIVDKLFADAEDKTLNVLIRENLGDVIKLIGDNINADQRGSIVSENGEKVKASGVKDLEATILNFLFEGGDVQLAEMFEDIPFRAKQGLTRSLPYILGVEEAKSIRDNVQNAIAIVYSFDKSGLDDFGLWANQTDAFNPEPPSKLFDPLDLEIAKRIIDAKKQSDVTSIFKAYSEAVEGVEADLFGGAVQGVDKGQAVKQVFNVEIQKNEKASKQESKEDDSVQNKADKGQQKETEDSKGKPKKLTQKDVLSILDAEGGYTEFTGNRVSWQKNSVNSVNLNQYNYADYIVQTIETSDGSSIKRLLDRKTGKVIGEPDINISMDGELMNELFGEMEPGEAFSLTEDQITKVFNDKISGVKEIENKPDKPYSELTDKEKSEPGLFGGSDPSKSINENSWEDNKKRVVNFRHLGRWQTGIAIDQNKSKYKILTELGDELWVDKKDVTFKNRDPYQNIEDESGVKPSDKASRGFLKWIIGKFKRVFPGIEVETDRKKFFSALNRLSNNGNAMFQQDPATKVPNAIYYDGTIYINPDKVRIDTPIHEFSHVFLQAVRSSNPAIYDAGVLLVKDSYYHDWARANYKKHTNETDAEYEDRLLEEALAQSIAEHGSGVFMERYKNRNNFVKRFTNWIKKLWESVQGVFGIRKVTDFQNLTLAGFNEIIIDNFYDKKNVLERQKKKLDWMEQNLTGFYYDDGNFREFILKKIQDKLRPLYTTQENIKSSGKDITEDIDAYMFSELQTGRIKDRVNALMQDVIKSKAHSKNSSIVEQMNRQFKKDFDGNIDGLVDAINKAVQFDLKGRNLDPLLEAWSLFMYAKHAPEANKALRERKVEARKQRVEELTKKLERAVENEQTSASYYQNEIDQLLNNEVEEFVITDNLSGMTNSESKAILDAIEKQGMSEFFDKYTTKFNDRVLSKLPGLYKEYGLVDEGLYDKLETTYENYVPLLVEEKALDKRTKSPSSRSVKSRDLYVRKGSAKYTFDKRLNVVMSALYKYQDLINNGEQNKTNLAMYELAMENPKEDFWEIVSPIYIEKYNKYGEPAGYDVIDEYDKETDIKVWVDGKPKMIRIHNKELREAMKGVGVMKAIPIIRNINNWLRYAYTIHNPGFIITNFEKDIVTAFVNLSIEEKEGLRSRFAKNIPKMFRAVYLEELGKTNSPGIDVVRDYKENGGDISWLDNQTMEEFLKKANNQISNINNPSVFSKGKDAFWFLYSYVDAGTRAAELATRVAAYDAMVHAGMSKQKAAQKAKNLTVNFEKKGNIGAFIDSIKLFTTAGIQSTYIVMKNIAKSPKIRKLAVGMIMFGFLNRFLNSLIDDDEYEELYKTFRDSHMILMIPEHMRGSLGVSHIKVPKAYGYGLFLTMGEQAFEVATDRVSVTEATGRSFLSLYNNLSPVKINGFDYLFTPTALEPIQQVYNNETWYGAPIYPNQPAYQPKKRLSSLYKDNVNPETQAFTEWLNNATFGNDYTAGELDLNPEVIDYLIGQYGGGTASFWKDLVTLPLEFKDGDLPPVRNIPIVRKFVGNTPKSGKIQTLWDMYYESGRTKFTKEEQDGFFNQLKIAKSEGYIEESTYTRLKNAFIKGQKQQEKSEDK